jgi:hypothetical protein
MTSADVKVRQRVRVLVSLIISDHPARKPSPDPATAGLA